MISRQELISDEAFEQQDEKIQANINELLIRINKIRSAYGQPMTVTSGFRTMEHHLEIYAAKGITDKKKIPMKSRHLTGQAVDILDTGEFLKNWVLANIEFIEKVGLWMESFSSTPTWVHFQIVPPPSKKIFFEP